MPTQDASVHRTTIRSNALEAHTIPLLGVAGGTTGAIESAMWRSHEPNPFHGSYRMYDVSLNIHTGTRRDRTHGVEDAREPAGRFFPHWSIAATGLRRCVGRRDGATELGTITVTATR